MDALYDPETYFIVDRGETKTNCNPKGDVPAGVVRVASPDERQWGGSAFSKRPREGRHVLLLPSLVLCGVGRRLQGTTYSEHYGRSNCSSLSIFGGIPRQVLFPVGKQENKFELQGKVAALTAQQVKGLFQGHINIHAGFGVDQPYGGIVAFKPVAGYIEVELELASSFILQQVRRCFMSGLWTELAVYPTHQFHGNS